MRPLDALLQLRFFFDRMQGVEQRLQQLFFHQPPPVGAQIDFLDDPFVAVGGGRIDLRGVVHCHDADDFDCVVGMNESVVPRLQAQRGIHLEGVGAGVAGSGRLCVQQVVNVEVVNKDGANGGVVFL